MLAVLSPSKKQDFSIRTQGLDYTLPAMRAESATLIEVLKGLSEAEIADLMGISPALSALNYARYHEYTNEFTQDNALQAILAFQGDVYAGLQARSMNKHDLLFAQQHVRILSGLYGALRPLDLMQAYRLEMGVSLKTENCKHLYAFWGEKITHNLNDALKESGSNVLVNLASDEYFSAIKPKSLAGNIITPVFKEHHKGELKVIGLFAKKARGMMVNYIIKQSLKEPEALKSFAQGGYRFDKSLSDDARWVFSRNQNKA